MVGLFADEDLSEPLAHELRRIIGYDVLTTREAWLANQGLGDAAQLRYASQSGRVLLTHNRRHFRRLHGQAPDHLGIVAISQTDNPVRDAARLHRLLADHEPMAGKFVCLNLPA